MKHDVVKVDSHDTLNAAVEDAMTRAESVFSAQKKTLVDSIPQGDWDKWDASQECPNVAGSMSISDDDEIDVAELSAA